jgi:hypothetical protein
MYGWLVIIINAERTQSYSLYTTKKETLFASQKGFTGNTSFFGKAFL